MRDRWSGANVVQQAPRKYGAPVTPALLEEWRSSPRLASAFLKKWRGSAGTLLDVMETMARQAVETNVFHFSAAIGSLASSRAWPAALQLIRASIAQQLQQNVVIYGAALQSCSSEWPAALAFLELMRGNQVSPNVVIYNSVMKAAASEGWSQVLLLLNSMREETVSPDVITFNTAIRSCDVAGQWALAIELVDRMRREGLVPDVITYNTVMDVCQKSGHWQLALQIFRLIRSHTADVITMNTAMGAYLKGGNWQQALLLLSDMPRKQLIPSTISYNVCIKACESGGRWDLAIHLLSSMRQQQIVANTVTYNTLLSILQKCGPWQEALHLLRSFPENVTMDVVSFNAAISACECVGQWQLALQLLTEMNVQQIRADQVTYSALMSSCDKVAQWEIALKLLREMTDAELSPDTIALNAAMASCARAKTWLQAVHLLDDMTRWSLEPDTASFNALALAASDGSAWRLVINVLSELLLRSMKPNEITFTTAMACLEHSAEATWTKVLQLVQLMDEVTVHSADALNLAAVTCCQVEGAWPKALALMKGDHPSNQAVSALLMRCEHDGNGDLGLAIVKRVATSLDVAAISAVLMVSQSLADYAGGGIPPLARSMLAPVQQADQLFSRTGYGKELLLLRHVLRAAPGSENTLQAMDSCGEELGDMGLWAKFAGGGKSATLRAAALGAAGGDTLEIGTYCGYSALSLAAAGAKVTTLEMDPVLVGISRCVVAHAGCSQLVRVFTGHSRMLLPRLEGLSRPGTKAGYDLIFMDRWGAQYPEDLNLIESLALLRPNGLLVADNVLRTVAAEFLWRISAGGRYITALVEVNEVAMESDEDWMSISIFRGQWMEPQLLPAVPAAWRELQKRSELMRVRTTSSASRVPRSEIQEVKDLAKKIFQSHGVGPT